MNITLQQRDGYRAALEAIAGMSIRPDTDTRQLAALCIAIAKAELDVQAKVAANA